VRRRPEIVAATFVGEEEGTSVPQEDEERQSVGSCDL
jgi:hypothetical protein